MNLLVTFLLMTSTPSFSEVITNEYYWVVESTTCREDSCIIRVYNEKHELVYTEKIKRKLDLKSKNTRKRLNRKVKKLRALREEV